jgi:hypothetical protein
MPQGNNKINGAAKAAQAPRVLGGQRGEASDAGQMQNDNGDKFAAFKRRQGINKEQRRNNLRKLFS